VCYTEKPYEHLVPCNRDFHVDGRSFKTSKPEIHTNNIEKKYVLISYKIHCISVRLTLFKEVIAVYCENHRKPINTLCGKGEKFLKLKQVVGTINIVL
jgi:hypothetical protein